MILYSNIQLEDRHKITPQEHLYDGIVLSLSLLEHVMLKQTIINKDDF